MSEEIDVDMVEKMRMRYKKEAQIAIEQAYQRGRDEGNEELEDKLRTRFRKEAQIAVENAYQRGKQEVANEIQNSSSLKDAEEEIKKWKAICESLGHSPSGKHITLVKFLMEQVYRDIKREFTEEAEVMERMKASMISIFVFSLMLFIKKESAFDIYVKTNRKIATISTLCC